MFSVVQKKNRKKTGRMLHPKNYAFTGILTATGKKIAEKDYI
jgi:hypothetical protein